MPNNIILSAAVEGIVDEAVVASISTHLGLTLHVCYVKGGKARLDSSLSAYNQAARQSPWFVLRDLDRDARCAAGFARTLLPDPSPLMCFRIAVRETEGWLLSDTGNLARFLGVSASVVPSDPELLLDAKQAVVNLAAKSRRRDIRQDMVPEDTARRVGPAYSSRLIEFALYRWHIGAARQRSNSLDRCWRHLERLRRSMTFDE